MTKSTGQLYPTSAVPPSFMASPKYTKLASLRPIVSSRNSITYGVAKELTYSIKPLVSQAPHHLKNTQHFVQQIHTKRLELGAVMTSFDVKALFTSVPVDPSVQIVQQNLAQDPTLPQRTSMSIQQIVTSWSSALKTHTSSSKVHFMNRSKVLLRVPPLVPS